jgi:hypothetical protein
MEWESLATLYIDIRKAVPQIWFAIGATAEYNSSKYYDTSSKAGERVLQHRLGHAGLSALALAALAAALPAAAQASADGHLRVLLRTAYTGQMHADLPPGGAKYVGPGSCSAVACHGGIQPRSVTKVMQNEYSTWVTSDKHAQAYASLTGSLGRQIATTLKIGPADKAQRCLVCHALSVGAALRARDFDVNEGVSCESCHGPASQWLGPHIQANALHAKMVELGLYDNKNLALRTERCLTCHLGAPGMSVDHELIAAGHPDLTFELDSFSAVEPPHWIEKNSEGQPSTDPLFGTRAWAIGQAVQLRESLLRVERHAKSGPWPEFSEMDCIACHHSLTGPLSWRQKTGFPGHRAGDPPYNLARYALFKHFAAEVDPNLNNELAASTARVSALVTSMSPDRAAVESAANRAAEQAARMTVEIERAAYDRARTERLLRAISADAETISLDGERTAEQATMTIDSLYIADAKAGATNPATRSAIDGLFKLVNNPSAYNAPQFAAQMHRVHDSLR